MLRAIRRPSATASRQARELVLEQDDVGDPLRHLGARAHRHRQPRLLQRRHVVDAVADHRRVAAGVAAAPRPAPSSARARSGRRSCSRCAASASSSGSLGQVGPSITPASARHADRVGDRGHGRARVAGDQLQVDLLLAHELDRLGGVGAQRLLEHDQRQRRQPRRRLGGGVLGQGLARLAEGDDPAPRSRSPAPSFAAARAEAQSAPTRSSTSGAPST